MNPRVHSYVPLDEVASADMNSIQDRAIDVGQLVGQLTSDFNGAWLGPRPTLISLDGSAGETQIQVGAQPGLFIGGNYLPPGAAVTITPILAASTWYYVYEYPVATTIASGSNNQTLPQASISVASTAGLASSGNVSIVTTNGFQTVAYGGLSGGNTLTGCTGGTGTMATGNAVAGAAFEVVTTVPDAVPQFKSTDATRRYIGCFRTDSGHYIASVIIVPFRMVGGRYEYKLANLPANSDMAFVLVNATPLTTALVTDTCATKDSNETGYLVPPHVRRTMFQATVINQAGGLVRYAVVSFYEPDLSSNTFVHAVIACAPGAHDGGAIGHFEMDVSSTRTYQYNAADQNGGSPGGTVLVTLQVTGFQEP